MVIFRQNNFIDGLNRELDETKIPRSAYPLLLNGRARRDVISPVQKHLRIEGPVGLYQGLYVAGSYIVLFCAGKAYYADITESPVIFRPVRNWTMMDASASRIYAELVSGTTNFFNRIALSDDLDPSVGTQTVFNDTIAANSQALFVFDNVNQPNVVFPSGATRVLKGYSTWTKDDPEYVPVGQLPIVLKNKLFLVSQDGTKVLHSVSGRMYDFVVNITNDGDKGGDAFTVATSASYNPLTALKALSSGHLLATTLYATYSIALDYDNTQFGEPDLLPSPLFPVGCVNDLSIADVIIDNLQDTAFITQSGIQSFNVVSQLNTESNNLPFGAKIQGLLSNPQRDTCTINFDDFSFFAVKTIYGYGALVYDNVRQNFQSLDLSFRHVKQFAVTKVNGQQRLFFITHTNEIFEGFASNETETTRVYLGEWSPQDADKDTLVNSVDLVFSAVRTAGYVKVTVFSDREEMESAVFQIDATDFTDVEPIPFPFTAKKQVKSVGFQLSNAVKSWKFGVAVEWTFAGNLTDVSVSGEQEASDNVQLTPQTVVSRQDFAFFADSGYGAELNPGGVFVNGNLNVDVVKGQRYVYYPGDDGLLVTGNIKLESGLFIANQNKVAIQGTTGNVPSFSLRSAENVVSVLDAIRGNRIPQIIGGGDHAYLEGSLVDVQMMRMVLDLPYWFAPGDHDLETNNGQYFFAATGKPRYYSKRFNYVEFFFYNPNELIFGPSVEPDGYLINSIQYTWLKNALADSTARFKIIVMHEPPYTTNDAYYPGYAGIRFPFFALGAHAVLSGHGHCMERIVINGFPYFVCGTGGESLNGFRAGAEDITSFRQAEKYGYLHIQSDPVSCKLIFRDTNNNELDRHTIYA